jgi:nucleotide-binding universal stress UspA family protein
MHSSGNRPRELRWYHAGPMLFGDWGTSRLYVLGLAFAFNGRASFWYVVGMCVLLVGVGLCYEIICRLFPDGGGVYSSAKHRSQLLAVVGALLLCADYVVTASLSCLDAFHYLGVQHFHLDLLGFRIGLDVALAAATILTVGGLNTFGPTKTGTVAMLVAVGTVALTLVIAAFSLPHLGSARLAPPLARGPWASWRGLIEIVLALSGVEAIANMTGIMVRPVEKTARRAIVPVMIEIVILNVVLALAMSSLPDRVLEERTPAGELAHTGDMLKVIAAHYVSPAFAAASSVVFAALLLSAVNTALSDLVSIQYMLSRDRELPSGFTGLNSFGMPKGPLLVASVVPAVVLLLFPKVEALADLYAIGVAGAISINLASTSTDRRLRLKARERGLMLLMTAIMVVIFATICLIKPHAREFALIVLVVGLAGRMSTIVINPAVPLTRPARTSYLAFAVASVATVFALAATLGGTWAGSASMAAVAFGIGYASHQTQRYRSLLPVPTTDGSPARMRVVYEGAYKPKERIMVATQGNPRLLEFALRECKNRQAELDLLFVRHVAVTPMGPVGSPRLEEDEQAAALFAQVKDRAIQAGAPLRLLYAASHDIPDTILDMAVTHGADLLLLGTTRRGALWKAMKGDVIQAVAEHLPENVSLLIHA